MNYYNGCGICVCVCVWGRTESRLRLSKELQSNEKESFEKPTWPRSLLHKSNGQLILPAESCRAEIQVWDMCVNKGPGRGHHTQDASLAAAVNGREKGLRLRLKQRQPQCIINLAASAHAYILISVYACEWVCVCVPICVSGCVCGSIYIWICEKSRWGFLCSFNYSIIINDITNCQCVCVCVGVWGVGEGGGSSWGV